MAAEDIGALYNTKMPGYDDAADIQEALKLFLYGSTTYDTANTNPSNLPNPSLARHLKDLRDDITVLETNSPGSDYASTEPASPQDGFIWVDATTTAPSIINFATAVYSNQEPESGLVDGLIWVDKSASPKRAYIYDATEQAFIPMNELQNVVDASGDLIYGTADNSIDNLPIGANGQVLTVSSGLPSWQSPKAWNLVGSGTLSGSSLSVSGISGDKIYIVLKDWSHDDATDSAMISIRFNNDAGPNYVNTGGVISSSALHSPTFADNITHDMTIAIDLSNTAAALKPVSTIAKSYQSGVQYFGYYKNTNTINSVQLFLSPSGSFDVGTYEIWSYN